MLPLLLLSLALYFTTQTHAQTDPETDEDTLPTTYNFLHPSLLYDTKDQETLNLFNNFMNDVLGYKNVPKYWSRILKCKKKKEDETSLFCYSLITDYYIASEEPIKAKETAKKGWNQYLKREKAWESYKKLIERGLAPLFPLFSFSFFCTRRGFAM